MIVQPYLFFDGRCDEALEFYKKTLGAQVEMVSRFKDAPDPAMRPPGMDEKIMHASFRIGESTLMASDGRCMGAAKFDGFSMSLTVKTIAEAQRTFAALSEGGQVQMPLTKTFYSPAFGMAADKFGVSWMVIVM